MPVDESKVQEHLPAAPLVMIAYAVRVDRGLRLRLVAVVAAGESRARNPEVSRRIDAGSPPLMGNMTSAHFIFIPSVLLVGIVIGWVLGWPRRARTHTRRS